MIRKLIHNIVLKSHFWRNTKFDELSELYTSIMMRSFGVGIVGIFVPIYLYDIGYSLSEIFLYFTIYFLSRPVFSFAAAALAALKGPKHTMFYSYLLSIAGFGLLLILPGNSWAFLLTSSVNGAAMTFFFVSLHVDFSKIKHTEHGGKELGYLIIMDRFGKVLGPLAGGLLAAYVGPQASIISAMVVIALSAFPLFQSREPVRLNQSLNYNGIKLKKFWRTIALDLSYTVDGLGTLFIWPLFIALFIAADNAYQSVGWLTALGAFVSVIVVITIGKLIDGKKAGLIFRLSAMGNFLLYFFRVFSSTLGMAALVNVANEPLTLGYSMPALKVLYDDVDKLEGLRIVAITVMEIISNLFRGVFMFFLTILSFYTSDRILMSTALLLIGAMSLGLFLHRSPLLRK